MQLIAEGNLFRDIMVDTVITISEGSKVTLINDTLIRVEAGATVQMTGPDGNEAPTSTATVADTAEGETVSLVGTSSSDPDGTISSYQWRQVEGSPVEITNATSSTATFTAPVVGSNLTFLLTVTDNDGSADISVVKFTSLEQLGNNAPTALIVDDFSADSESAVNLDGTGSSDSDGTIDAYSWVQTVGTSVILSNADTATASFTAPTVSVNEVLTFQLTVTDNDGSSGVDTINVTIEPITVTPFDITREASRTSGVAPLSVFFTAGFNTSTPIVRDFHDLEYSWVFDDSGSGTWPDSGKSRNTDKGPVASHVFESVGTYTVALTVKNASGTVDTDTFVITVTDPDTVFSTTNTIVINKVGDSDFTGKPTGATEVNSDDFSIVLSHIGSGKRVLYKRGSSWAQSGSINLPTLTTAYIGAYGTGTSPDDRGIFANAPAVTVSGSGDLFLIDDTTDLRIAEITSNTPVTDDGGMIGSNAGGIKQFLGLRLKVDGTPRICIQWSHWRTSDAVVWQENSIISCVISEANVNNTFIGSEKLTFMGNHVFNSRTSHVVRVWWAYKAVMLHNDISGSSLDNSNGRHAIKYGSPGASSVGTFAETGNSGLPYHSDYGLIANNVIGSSGFWPVAISPQNPTSDERISDVIFEKNKLLAEYGEQSATLVSIQVYIAGRYITARNNIMDGTGAGNGYTGIAIERRGIEPTPLGVHLYNNTIYKSTATQNLMRGITIDGTATDTIVKNNFASFPNDTTSVTMILDSSGIATLSNNLLSNNNGFIDPDNATPLSRDFSLGTGSAAENAGTTVPVLDDFDDVMRAGVYELGAYQK